MKAGNDLGRAGLLLCATSVSLCLVVLKRRTIQVCKAIDGLQRRSARRVAALDATSNRKTQRGSVQQ